MGTTPGPPDSSRRRLRTSRPLLPFFAAKPQPHQRMGRTCCTARKLRSSRPLMCARKFAPMAFFSSQYCFRARAFSNPFSTNSLRIGGP